LLQKTYELCDVIYDEGVAQMMREAIENQLELE
jgi:hypothetical protein